MDLLCDLFLAIEAPLLEMGKKLQSTEFQHYPSINGEVNSCHVISVSKKLQNIEG